MRLALISILFLASCTHKAASHLQPKKEFQVVAEASLAQGKVVASAVRVIENKNLCFDITLYTHGKQDNALASNWSAAWIDKDQQYHLISMAQRNPSSTPRSKRIKTPRGTYKVWTNYFRSCAPGEAGLDEVKSLVLTPKELPYNKDQRSLELSWN